MRKGTQVTFTGPDGRTQAVYPDERKRIEILERQGWRRGAATAPATAAAGTETATRQTGRGPRRPATPTIEPTVAAWAADMDLSAEQIATLEGAGLGSREALLAAPDADLLALPGIGPGPLLRIRAQAGPTSSGGALDEELFATLALTDEQAQALQLAGLESAETLRAADDDVLLGLPGIGQATLKRIREATKE